MLAAKMNSWLADWPLQRETRGVNRDRAVKPKEALQAHAMPIPIRGPID